MKRSSMAVLLVLVAVFALFGCTDFRRQAEEAQTRIANAEETARIAEQAAAQNTARILDLEDRVEALEEQLDELLQHPEDEAE